MQAERFSSQQSINSSTVGDGGEEKPGCFDEYNNNTASGYSDTYSTYDTVIALFYASHHIPVS